MFGFFRQVVGDDAADKMKPFMKQFFPSSEMPQKPSNKPVTRWEKAITAFNSIAKTVAKIDEDGIDVYTFQDGNVQKYMCVKNAESIMQVVKSQEPMGECTLRAGLEQAIADANDTGYEKPCSVLVITAGRPVDKDGVMELLRSAGGSVDGPDKLTFTVVQVGSDPEATAFLADLDTMECFSSDGDKLDMVDTVKDEDLKSALAEMKDPGFIGSGGGGMLLGAFAGMAMGAGAYYMYNKKQAEKRTEGWNGQWMIFTAVEEDTGVRLTVADDMGGNLTIEGYPEDGSAGIPSPTGTYSDDAEGYTISRIGADGSCIGGTVVDEHTIQWSDDSVWHEVSPDGVNWSHMAGAAALGATAGGATGYLVHKKFFSKANKGEKANYKIVLDCSDLMNCLDD